MNEAATIQAGLQAAIRQLRRDGMPDYTDTGRVIAAAMLQLHDSEVERLLGYFLDRDCRLIEVEELSVGGLHGLVYDKYLPARRAALHGACHAVFAHCHPNGDPTPSPEDREAADTLDSQLAAVGCMVLRHMVIASNGVADIRTGHIVRLEDLVDHDPTETTPGPRCPHCGGALTS
ncbi:MAG: DNA repair protein RadC [bacterium]|nr:MAG: DNA repair protein RadC [bacterium]KAF0147928.1 MAG: DNA repair protein RadC [bacterium]KAF0168110.1 MAG: DNA repair protein RadC [bacterium]TXT22569.1 MAG: DNA repair protein RadC [bacterium]